MIIDRGREHPTQMHALPGQSVEHHIASIDNRATAASDYSPFVVTARLDPRLPGGGGVIGGVSNLNPDKVGLVDNYVTPASNYGNMYQHWNGIDVGVNVRVQQGLML